MKGDCFCHLRTLMEYSNSMPARAGLIFIEMKSEAPERFLQFREICRENSYFLEKNVAAEYCGEAAFEKIEMVRDENSGGVIGTFIAEFGC